MASPSPPLSRAISPESTEYDSDNDEEPSALPHTSPASQSTHDNPTSSSRPASAVPISIGTYGNPEDSYYQTPANGHQPHGTRKLIDYEEQLRLLEMQNKKRLMMAKQEQDSMVYSPVKHPLSAPENETNSASQMSAMDRNSRSPPSLSGSQTAQQQQPSITMNQVRADQARLHQARLQLQLQEYSSHKTAQTAREKQNQGPIQDFDFDSSLKPDRSYEAWDIYGPSLFAPSGAAAPSPSFQELAQIQAENDRKAHLENVARQQQYMVKQRAAQQAVFATQMANRGPNSIYRASQELLLQQARTIHPQNPHYVSAQTMHSRTQGPPLYHTFQTFGSRTASYPQPGMMDNDELPLPPGLKRPSSFDDPGNDRASKKSKGVDSGDEGGDKAFTKISGNHEHSSPACSPDPNMTDKHNLSEKQKDSSLPHITSSSKGKAIERPQEESRNDDRDKQGDAPEEETSKASPAHSSTTLDDEDDRAPLNEIEMDIDQENATEMKSTELESGISVTTTTFKDGKTMTVMRVGDGSVKSKAREMRQGVEIITKTVVIQGVVTTTTTTALIPMAAGAGGQDDEGEWDE